MQQVKHAGSTNLADDTIIKVVTSDKSLTWISPAENAVFKITQDAQLPSIVFEFHSKTAGEFQWSWVIEWEAKVRGLRERARKNSVLQTFSESGAFTSNSTSWTVDLCGKVLGGTLTVKVNVGGKILTRSVLLKGQNPTRESIASYVTSLEDMFGFEKLLEQETGSKHFIDLDGEPITAFDKGYGITQMTQPAPNFEQVWNWKANILAGSAVYKDKVRIAKKYLGQSGRSYTDDQLQHEVFSRWNGGSYHVWDSASGAWVRKKNILCDSATGNIGWSMDNEKNKEKSESALHERDKGTYSKGSKGQSEEHPWEYKGMCYADHVLGQ
ncbi:hypothetical protein HNO86_27850 [Pseudomonas sp. C1C7]|uniref:hypothetical protein n=1 Tax=Pseudomonas sp. C1C7 TaxID=2735272 RepID=UPI0015865555|nr:hypothetical protein [Pseudomonas sp. C1C7]NUT78861.1 hypothetical protein [Pseudomonas sp. C1C7]